MPDNCPRRRYACRGYKIVARIRRLRRIREISPAVLRLPGLQNRSLDKTVTPHPGTLPGGAALAIFSSDNIVPTE
ncbi:TPA: hypothetical protein I8235_001455 [Kluyvera intermedia]|nr:hypothetical protein [Kluyvera intermedia]